jgi:hypothetical protein
MTPELLIATIAAAGICLIAGCWITWGAITDRRDTRIIEEQNQLERSHG